jgi:XTP/dITP diphosphohydrolase
MNYRNTSNLIKNDPIVIATFNYKKSKEIEKILKSFLPDIKFLSLKNFNNIKKIEEDGNSFEENAIKKAKGYYNQIRKNILAEDSGLVVEALNGAPGVYSSRFSGEKSNDYLNNIKLLKLLEKIPTEKRNAKFISVVALANEDGIHTFRGELRGKISFDIRGKSGFGYDPVFIPNGYDKTLAELGPAIKDKISHRFKALKLTAEYLTTFRNI